MTGPNVVEGRVLRGVGGSYLVEAGDETIECALRGRLKRKKELGKVAVGDMVEVERLEDGSCAITDVRERRNKLSRRTAHGRREQVIAANVDALAPVLAVAQPDPDFDLLDRFLVLAENSEIHAFLVVNKIDLSSESAAREQYADYGAAGYEMTFTSAESGAHVDELADRLAGRTTLLVGPSGVGKSSLLNAVQPGLGLRVGEISKQLEGRHTTVEATLHPLDVGGYVVDTPGLRRLHFWEVGTATLDWCFPEFRAHLGECRFPDCSHAHEPGCAVAEAVERGQVSRRRYESYLRILEERASEKPY